jgi:midasin (ATPase involved in ribosome maturation)
VTSAPSDRYNFYRDANPSQSALVTAALAPLASRLTELLEQWPDHATPLIRLRALCDRILDFAVTSPIPKFLTGLEMLLVEAQDWESYASSHVSLLGEHLSHVTSLVVSWRRMELSAWPKLLDAEEASFRRQAARWWFHLHDGVFARWFEDSRDTDAAEDIAGLTATLDQFLLSAPLGEFQTRLSMLGAFHGQLVKHRRVRDDELVPRVARNTVQYFSQFASAVSRQRSREGGSRLPPAREGNGSGWPAGRMSMGTRCGRARSVAIAPCTSWSSSIAKCWPCPRRPPWLSISRRPSEMSQGPRPPRRRAETRPPGP